MIRSRIRRAREALDERGTSPTIGAVLLVGVTVVVATTAGVYFASFGGHGQQPFAVASVEFDEPADRATATWRANANADELRVSITAGDDHRTVTLTRVGQTATIDRDGITVSGERVGSWDHPAVDEGETVTVTVVAATNESTIVVAERTATL